MAVSNGNNHRNGKFLLTAVVATVGAVGGASSGTYIYLNQMPPEVLQQVARPDPFTGTQGDDFQRQISKIQREVDRLPPRELTERIALLEREVELLREEIDRLTQ